MSTDVATIQRFSRTRPCPICGGWEGANRGDGRRCFGFLSRDGAWAHCTRQEHAGGLPSEPSSQTYAHRLSGPCKCGTTHGPRTVNAPGPGGVRAQSRIVATYDYADENGKLLFQVVRLDPKGFRQRRPNGAGKWTWKLNGVRRVLYRLSQLLKSNPAEPVFVAEGEKDVDALCALGLTATCNPGGANKWHTVDDTPLHGAGNVVVIADRDKPGLAHARDVAERLTATGTAAKVIELPDRDGHAVKDASDWIGAGGTRAELAEIVAKAPEYVPAPERVAETATGARPRLFAGGAADLAVIADQAREAVSRWNAPPSRFLFGGVAVRVEVQDGATRLVPESVDSLREVLARAADWFTVTKEGEERAARPPADVARVLAAGEASFLPTLTRLARAPFVAPDGRIVEDAGFDAATGTYYVPGGLRVPPIPSHPTPEDAAEARRLIVDDLLSDFPWVDRADAANAAALFLLPFARQLIDGPTPLHLIEKPTPGCGAGLLVETLATVATGEAPSLMSEGGDEEEWRKRITATLLAGADLICVDNLRRRLDSAALSAVLTLRTWTDRRLGVSETVSLPVRAIWIANGNNPTVSAEIGRRCVPIRIDPKVERPWERPPSEFRHQLPGWARAERGRLVAAALTWIRAWVEAGRPSGGEVFGSYEGYAGVLGGILHVGGVVGFLANRTRFYARADVETTNWHSFLAAWWAGHGASPVAVKDLWPLIETEAVASPVDLGRGNERSQRTRLGMALRGIVGRRFAPESLPPMSVESAGVRHSGALFALEVHAPATEGTGERGNID